SLLVTWRQRQGRAAGRVAGVAGGWVFVWLRVVVWPSAFGFTGRLLLVGREPLTGRRLLAGRQRLGTRRRRLGLGIAAGEARGLLGEERVLAHARLELGCPAVGLRRLGVP